MDANFVRIQLVKLNVISARCGQADGYNYVFTARTFPLVNIADAGSKKKRLRNKAAERDMEELKRIAKLRYIMT